MSTSSVNNNREKQASDTRDAYKQREADLKKQQAEETKRIHRQYSEKIRELNAKHQEQLAEAHDRGEQRLSDKDVQYQKEIEKIRTAYTQQQKNSAQNYERELRQLHDSHESELNKTEETHKSQTTNLSNNFQNALEQKSEQFEKDVDELRDKQADALVDQKERLESRRAKDENIFKKEQDEKINDLTSELNNTRRQKNAEIKTLKLQNMVDREEGSQNTIQSVVEERKTNNALNSNMRDQYDQNLSDLRDKYQQYNLEAKTGKSAELQRIKDDAELRQRQQLGDRDRKLREQKNNSDLERIDQQKAFNSEKKAYMNETKESLQNVESQREKIYETVNDQTHQEIKDITKRHNDLIDRQHKYYQSRLSEKDDKYQESLDGQVNSLKMENEDVKKRADLRQSKMNFLNAKDKNGLEEYYKEMLEEKDKTHQEEMVQQREVLTKDKKETVKMLETKLRNNEAKNTEKLNLLSQKYEREIMDIKEEQKLEKKRMANEHNKRVDEITKGDKFELETQKTQSEAREAQLKEKFERQVSQMQNRQDDERIKSAMKKS